MYESVKAGTNRLIKLNLYHIFCEDLQAKKAPWGILHGVRPTKSVHRLMEQIRPSRSDRTFTR